MIISIHYSKNEMMALDKEKLAKKFPGDFPIEELPDGAKEENIQVYRICRTGSVEPRSFLPSNIDPDIVHTKENDGEEDIIGKYSLSTYEKRRDARQRLRLFSRTTPAAIAAYGVTDPSCGLVQRTKERKQKKDSHVDWWLYKGAEPHKFFKAVDILNDSQ